MLMPAEQPPASDPSRDLPDELGTALQRYVDLAALLSRAGARRPLTAWPATSREALIAAFLASDRPGPITRLIEDDIRRLLRSEEVLSLFRQRKQPSWRRWLERRFDAFLGRPKRERLRLPRLREAVSDEPEERDRRLRTSFVQMAEREEADRLPAPRLAALARLLLSPGQAEEMWPRLQASATGRASLAGLTPYPSPFDRPSLASAIRRALRTNDVEAAERAASAMIDRLGGSAISGDALEEACGALLAAGQPARAAALADAWMRQEPASQHARALRAWIAGESDPEIGLAELAGQPALDEAVARARARLLLRLGRPDEAEAALRAAINRPLGRRDVILLRLLHDIYAARGDPNGFAETAALFRGAEATSELPAPAWRTLAEEARAIEQQDPVEARRLLEKAILLLPLDAPEDLFDRLKGSRARLSESRPAT